MKEDLLRNTQNKLRIISVNMQGGNFLVNDDKEDIASVRSNYETKTQSFRMANQIKEIFYEPDEEGKTIYEYKFTYSLGTRLIHADQEEESKQENFKPIAEIVAVFVAKYRSFEKISEEGLDLFAKSNICYHIWPYWREYVQSTCTRIGLNPVLSIPHYFADQDDS